MLKVNHRLQREMILAVRCQRKLGNIRVRATKEAVEWGSLDHGDEWSWDGHGWNYTGTERPYSAPWEVSDEE